MYPKRLIEVDLPIARISAHARREKSVRHGHIATLHLWWARRPLGACRAVICATLWPDPADDRCPRSFTEAATRHMIAFAKRVNPERITDEKHRLQATVSIESRGRWEALAAGTLTLDADDPTTGIMLRMCLLDFLADFANWDSSTIPAYLETSRAITQAAHEALGGIAGTRPLVVDPFAGGGSIPLEALRVGADTFASDLNPIPVLLNKTVLEYIPTHEQRLVDEVRKWGEWIKMKAEAELTEFYPKDSDGSTPIAYLWARTIQCEGPVCGAEVPLLRSRWLAKKGTNIAALRIIPREDLKGVVFRVIFKCGDRWVDRANPECVVTNPTLEGTVKRGSATCPCCGYTTPVSRVREQLKLRAGGAHDARLMCVVTTRDTEKGRFFREVNETDLLAVAHAAQELDRQSRSHRQPLSLVPDEPISLNEIRRISVPLYGIEKWGSLFTLRQALALTTLTRLVREAGLKCDGDIRDAVTTCLAMAIGRQADHGNSGCTWNPSGPKIQHLFARQALPITLDFAEAAPFGDSVGDWLHAIDNVLIALANAGFSSATGSISQASATQHPLPNDSASAIVTDPPYYDSVPYAYLSDFFYVWMRRILDHAHPSLFSESGVPKDAEIVVDRPHHLSQSKKDVVFYERELQKAFAEGRRVVRPDGLGVIVFASKTTSSWQAILKAVVDAGWIITGSWPIDTEMETRISAHGQARLASSVHLVCRPRENSDGSQIESVGEWRDILGELPRRIHEWMPRLAAEGVVGADAIFACLGPALEVFSCYSRVEKANGETATLREYLEFVWAAVSTEALALIFKDADASGLEPDARLTAMWLWTLGGGTAQSGNGKRTSTPDTESEDETSYDDHEISGSSSKGTFSGGFTLEFDAARKIAQGLGVHLEQCESLVEVNGDNARLLPVSERTKYLFGQGTQVASSGGRTSRKVKQKTLFHDLDEAEAAEAGWTELKGPPPGSTVLDRVHQAMILFAANRGELLRRFLVEDGVGQDSRFWKLADNLNKLYPPGTEERRWVEGVLARKKGLGL
jgi:putative DNA methylase